MKIPFLTDESRKVELDHLRRRLGREALRQQPRLPPPLGQVLERLRVRLHEQPGPVVPVVSMSGTSEKGILETCL